MGLILRRFAADEAHDPCRDVERLTGGRPDELGCHDGHVQRRRISRPHHPRLCRQFDVAADDADRAGRVSPRPQPPLRGPDVIAAEREVDVVVLGADHPSEPPRRAVADDGAHHVRPAVGRGALLDASHEMYRRPLGPLDERAVGRGHVDQRVMRPDA